MKTMYFTLEDILDLIKLEEEHANKATGCLTHVIGKGTYYKDYANIMFYCANKLNIPKLSIEDAEETLKRILYVDPDCSRPVLQIIPRGGIRIILPDKKIDPLEVEHASHEFCHYLLLGIYSFWQLFLVQGFSNGRKEQKDGPSVCLQFDALYDACLNSNELNSPLKKARKWLVAAYGQFVYNLLCKEEGRKFKKKIKMLKKSNPNLVVEELGLKEIFDANGYPAITIDNSEYLLPPIPDSHYETGFAKVRLLQNKGYSLREIATINFNKVKIMRNL